MDENQLGKIKICEAMGDWLGMAMAMARQQPPPLLISAGHGVSGGNECGKSDRHWHFGTIIREEVVMNHDMAEEEAMEEILHEKIVMIMPAQPGWRMVARNGDTVSEDPIVCWALVEPEIKVTRPESSFNRLPDAPLNKLPRSQRCPRRYVKAMCRVGATVQLDESGDSKVRYLAPGECLEQ